MFDAFDEALKKLLEKEIPIKKNEIDIVFDQPTGEWSSGVNKPTLNIFLHDIRENVILRGAEQFQQIKHPDGTVEIRRNPARIDLHYLITAWSNKETDQHHLLGLTLMALLRAPFLPKELCQDGLDKQPIPIPLEVAQPDPSKNWSDFWNTMGNKPRPGLTLKATMLIDPYRAVTSPMVRGAEIVFQQEDHLQRITVESKRYYVVGGEIESEKYDLSTLKLVWEEKNKQIPLEENRFRINKVEAGTHHLTVRFNERALKRQQFTVPSEEPLKIEV